MIPLTTNSVHVWTTPLTASPERLAELLELLSDDERQRAARYTHIPSREQNIIARAALRIILARYLSRSPTELTFLTGDNGKPFLSDRELFFNISHSKSLAVFAVTCRDEIGIDVEQLRPQPTHLEMATRFFATGEIDALRALPATRREEAFFHIWTRKEAFIKAVGLGLAYGLDRFEVSVPPDDPARLRHLDGDVRAAAEWSMLSLTPAAGYVAALAIKGAMPTVEMRTL